MKRKLLGKYIVADPEICHGKPTFVGTRIMVFQVLRQLESGLSWDEVVDAWRGRVPKAAIAEAIELARMAFMDRGVKYALEVSKP